MLLGPACCLCVACLEPLHLPLNSAWAAGLAAAEVAAAALTGRLLQQAVEAAAALPFLAQPPGPATLHLAIWWQRHGSSSSSGDFGVHRNWQAACPWRHAACQRMFARRPEQLLLAPARPCSCSPRPFSPAKIWMQPRSAARQQGSLIQQELTAGVFAPAPYLPSKVCGATTALCCGCCTSLLPTACTCYSVGIVSRAEPALLRGSQL